MTTKITLLAVLVLLSIGTYAQDTIKYVPEIHGFTLFRMEQNMQTNTGRFALKNARVNIVGSASKFFKYRTDIAFNNEGTYKLLDAYIQMALSEKLSLKVGAMKTPAWNEFMRPSVEACFSNFSYINTMLAPDMYDMGALLSYDNKAGIPFSLSAGLFNGFYEYFKTKVPQRDGYNLSLRAAVEPVPGLNLSGSYYKGRSVYATNPFTASAVPSGVGATGFFTDIISFDAAYKTGGFLIEGEFMQRSFDYNTSVLAKFNKTAFYVMSQYEMTTNGALKRIIPAIRYDNFKDDNPNIEDNTKNLLSNITNSQDRLTLGLTFNFAKYSYSDIRINYERALSNNTNADLLCLDFLIRF